MSNMVFNVYERNVKENPNILRKAGEVPGIIYGEFLDKSIPVKLKDKELNKMLNTINSGSIIKIDLDGKNLNCVIKEVQKDNFGKLLHIDFQYTKPNEVIKMKIPVEFIGQDTLISKNLLLNTSVSSIEFQGKTEDIPEHIQIDVSNMKLNDKIFIKDVSVPKSVTVLDNPDNLIATVNYIA